MTDQSKPDGALDVAALLEGTTPPPWKVGQYGISGPDYARVVDVVEGNIYDEYDSDPATIEIGDADAALLAAAPRIAREHIALTDALAVANARVAELEGLIRECRLADRHAARTGDEVRWDRAFHTLCAAERSSALTGPTK